MANEKKIGSGIVATIGVGVLVALRTLSHGAESLRPLFPTVDHSIAQISTTLVRFSEKNHDDEIFVSALCNSVAGVANGVPPDENVGDSLISAVEERVGVPLSLPQDKFNQIEATFKLSQWNGGMAAKYIQVCHKAGFPTF